VNTVSDHYAQLLAPVYTWMSGSVEAALDAGKTEIDELQLQLPTGALVADLGAGFGKHAIPLARAGMRVLAVDGSTELLQELDRLSTGLGIESVADDLLSFRTHLEEKAAAVLCMGDTLTHLPEHTPGFPGAGSPRGLGAGRTLRALVSRLQRAAHRRRAVHPGAQR
jgi:SAM-dependent methyltransferase